MAFEPSDGVDEDVGVAEQDRRGHRPREHHREDGDQHDPSRASGDHRATKGKPGERGERDGSGGELGPRRDGDLRTEPPVFRVRVALRHRHARRNGHRDGVRGEGDQDHLPARGVRPAGVQDGALGLREGNDRGDLGRDRRQDPPPVEPGHGPAEPQEERALPDEEERDQADRSDLQQDPEPERAADPAGGALRAALPSAVPGHAVAAPSGILGDLDHGRHDTGDAHVPSLSVCVVPSSLGKGGDEQSGSFTLRIVIGASRVEDSPVPRRYRTCVGSPFSSFRSLQP